MRNHKGNRLSVRSVGIDRDPVDAVLSEIQYEGAWAKLAQAFVAFDERATTNAKALIISDILNALLRSARFGRVEELHEPHKWAVRTVSGENPEQWFATPASDGSKVTFRLGSAHGLPRHMAAEILCADASNLLRLRWRREQILDHLITRARPLLGLGDGGRVERAAVIGRTVGRPATILGTSLKEVPVNPEVEDWSAKQVKKNPGSRDADGLVREALRICGASKVQVKALFNYRFQRVKRTERGD